MGFTNQELTTNYNSMREKEFVGENLIEIELNLKEKSTSKIFKL